MNKHQTIIPWILVAVTLPLLGILAWNQFNWLQELQKREKERIQYSMISSARAVSKRLQEELLFLPSLLHIKDETPASRDTVFFERYQFWQYYAISPSMIKEIALIDEKADVVFLWKTDHFEKSDSQPEKYRDDGVTGMQIQVPVFFGHNSRYDLVCVFDDRRMIEDIIPELARESLDSTDIYAYRIVDTRDDSLVYTSSANYSPALFAEPDIEVPLLEEFRVPNFQSAPPLPKQIDSETALDTFPFIKQRTKIDTTVGQDDLPAQPFGSFILQIVNLDGSLTELSRKSTVQNALLSFGIVGLLVLLMVSLAEATRRSNALALSQQEFIATITHELKTPLAVISSAAQNLTDGLIKDQKKAEQYGQMIRKEAARLGVSIEHFLLYSNTSSITRMKPVLCDVSELIQAALKFTEEERGKAEFRTEVIIPEEPVFIRGDRIALESVFQNLAQNVLRHAKDGKYLGIIVTIESGTKKDERRKVVIKFRDKGPGIPAREQKMIFEPFSRGRRAIDNQVPGNGIGLNLVKRIVTVHEGSIALESVPDKGSTFIITLPESKGDNNGE